MLRTLLNNMIARFIGYILHLANSSPPEWRQEFYAMKEKILIKYGKIIGHDLQHIKKMCWSCNGSGTFITGEGRSVRCYRCFDGVYTEFWCLLEVWNIGEYEFHSPVTRYQSYSVPEPLPKVRNKIEGYIEHKRHKHYVCREAFYWLAFLFDPKLFFKVFGKCGHRTYKLPMVAIASILFNIRYESKYRFRKLKSMFIAKFRPERDDGIPF